MLVIDRVDLALVKQTHQMGELHRDDPRVGEKKAHAFDEVIQIWHVSQDIVSDQQISAQPLVRFGSVFASTTPDRGISPKIF